MLTVVMRKALRYFITGSWDKSMPAWRAMSSRESAGVEIRQGLLKARKGLILPT